MPMIWLPVFLACWMSLPLRKRRRNGSANSGALGSSVHTDLHECLGHGSGKMLPGITTEALRNYYSTIEEARADLFALYYMMDPKLIELGIIPSQEVAKAEYCSYIRNGLMVQLTRIKPGAQLEESHMRNRQTIAAWVYDRGRGDGVIERVRKKREDFFCDPGFYGFTTFVRAIACRSTTY